MQRSLYFIGGCRKVACLWQVGELPLVYRPFWSAAELPKSRLGLRFSSALHTIATTAASPSFFLSYPHLYLTRCILIGMQDRLLVLNFLTDAVEERAPVRAPPDPRPVLIEFSGLENVFASSAHTVHIVDLSYTTLESRIRFPRPTHRPRLGARAHRISDSVGCNQKRLQR